MTYTVPEDVMSLVKQGKKTGWNTYKIATNFTWAEVFGSMQGSEWEEISISMLNNAQRKAWWLQAQRDRYGPIKVTSWLRPETYNRRIGGASRSKHKQGHAVDWIPLTAEMEKVFEDIKDSDFQGGIAIKKFGFIHSDLRSTRVTWNY